MTKDDLIRQQQAVVAHSGSVLAELGQRCIEQAERLAAITPGPPRIAPVRVAFVDLPTTVADSPESRYAMRRFGVRI